MIRAPGEYAPLAGLDSLDYVFQQAISWTVGAGAGVPSPRPISRTAAALLVLATGVVSIALDGTAIAASPAESSITLAAGGAVQVGIELAQDVTPFAFNGTGAAVIVTVIVLRRRRLVERLFGQE